MKYGQASEQRCFYQDHLCHHCFKVNIELSPHSSVTVSSYTGKGEKSKKPSEKEQMGRAPQEFVYTISFSLLYQRNASLKRERSLRLLTQFGLHPVCVHRTFSLSQSC